MIVYCAVLSVCTSASLIISTPTISPFSLGSVACFSYKQHFNHTITKQELEFTMVLSSCHLHMVSKRKERKYRGEILPSQKPSLFTLDITHMWFWKGLQFFTSKYRQ